MFTLLHPSALLALLGLLVPVAIHLWNRRPGQEVAVGSLRWLAAGANRRLRNLKPEQLWLLLLRAAVLAVLAVAIAGPVQRQAQPASRGVVLLSVEAARLPALMGVKPTIDSLRRAGYALRWLAAGFPKVSGSAWRALAAGHSSRAADSVAAGQRRGTAWARVQQATASFPGQPLLVVTSAALHNFRGPHATLPALVSWQALPDTTTATWLAAAEIVGDSLQLLVGHSSETRTTYRREKVQKESNNQPFQAPGLGSLRFQSNENGQANLVVAPASASSSTNRVVVEANPLLIEIYASPTYTADARYLEAALRAAAVGLPIPPILRRVKALPKQLNANWTFWLSEEPLPQGWQAEAEKQGRHLWQAGTGPGVADTAQLVTAGPTAASVLVFRRTTTPPAAGSNVVWADGRGRPVLSRQALGQGAMFRLHTRLTPTWSELADDPQLPAHLLELLQPETLDNGATSPNSIAQAEATHDHRALDVAQLPGGSVPAAGQNTATAGSKVQPVSTYLQTDWQPWLVLFAGLLFTVERWLASRRPTENPSYSA